MALIKNGADKAFRFKNTTPNAVIFGDPTPKWRRPNGSTEAGAPLFVLVEPMVYVGRRPDGTPIYQNQYLDLVIEPGETVAVDEDTANAIHQSKCDQCNIPFRFGRAVTEKARRASTCCWDLSHKRTLIGGLCPKLEFVGDKGEASSTMHPDLEEVARPVVTEVAEIEQAVRKQMEALRHGQ